MTGPHLSKHHRDTVEKILRHPASGNVEWREVLSLLEAVGSVTREHNGSVRVKLGPETETFHPPRGKDIDKQVLVDLRRMLTGAGFGDRPAAEAERSRDHGDGRWGEPGAGA